ncbi:MAG: class II aldolase/adducin family protein [Bdellovibrionaceae bacterium]|nr:class II aldolase/adducin family protein [Pseudobdellovibrionaceae bacterium]
MNSHSEINDQILLICQRLHTRNMLSAADGNISFRIDDQHILITPSGIAKAFMKVSDMAVINLDNKIISGNPSSERLMHLEVYKNCPEARAVIHAHPMTAIAWSIAHPEMEKLPSDCLSEVILATGDIPFVKYARPGTQAMGDVLKPYLPQCKAMILSRHGAITWGESLDEAYRGMERIENSAQILATAKQLGGIHPLPKEEIEYLYELRKKIGNVLL